MTKDQTFVIVGASLAGAKAAETLREEGFAGRLVLIGREQIRPYERPPLSKDYLRGEADRDAIFVHDEGFYRDHDIELRLGEVAVSIDPGRREVATDRGERFAFDRLLLSTGSEPRPLTVPGAELEGVHQLRSAESSDAIRAGLSSGARVVVIGAGWIGCEVAASARQLGAEVTMIEPSALPLERVLGAELGAVYRDIHRDHGVELLLGTGVVAIEGSGRAERVLTGDGRAIDCDLVVAGIGAIPSVELGASAGLAVDNGILVDATLQTSAPGIYAAGDVAGHAHPLYGRLRVEHWANALHQGPAAARNMLGANEAYARIPYFFSDQYDVGMEYAGHSGPGDRVVFRGDPAGREFIAFWLREGRVTAGMNVNVWDVTDQIQALVAAASPIEESALIDPDVALTSLIAAST